MRKKCILAIVSLTFVVCRNRKTKGFLNYQRLSQVSIFMKKKYDQMVKFGLCTCSHCKPMKFRSKGIWILREINHEFQYDTK